ncbi:hypothetical protein N2152v2_000888 [Parachlorella kessleri]
MTYELVDALPDIPSTNLGQNYERLYVPNASGVAGNDQALYFHPNGLCLVAMAPAHAALIQGSDACDALTAVQPETEAAVSDAQLGPAASVLESAQLEVAAGRDSAGNTPLPMSVDFDVGRSNLLNAEFKKGRGPWLSPESAICRVTTNGRDFLLRSLVKGALVEVNDQLQGAFGPTQRK